MLVYMATVGEASTDSGEQVRFDSIPSDRPLKPSGYIPRRFATAAQEQPDDTQIVVALTRPSPTIAAPPDTLRMKPFFEQWERTVGREIEYVELPNTADAEEFYRHLADHVDAWVEHHDEIDVYLGGDDSIADALAWLSCLHGLRWPRHVRIHTFQQTMLNEDQLQELPLHRSINQELTREHARSRIERWEFLEVRALERLHHELSDVGPLLEAAARFVQRNPRQLQAQRLVDDGNIPTEWRYTEQLCHAIEIAEYMVTVQRHEEETAWYVVLACLELAPAAWAERYLSTLLGGTVELEDGLAEFEQHWVADYRAGGESYLRECDEPVYRDVTADAACLLARVGAPAVRVGDQVVRRRALPRDPDLPIAPMAHLLWLALRAGLRQHRNTLAHFFEDLDEDTLRSRVLRPAAVDAHQAVADLADLSGGEERTERDRWQQRVLQAVDDGARGRSRGEQPTGSAARAVWDRLLDEQPWDEEFVQYLRSTVPGWFAAAPPYAPAHRTFVAILVRLRRDHAAAYEDVMADLRSLRRADPAPIALEDREELQRLLSAEALTPTPLTEGSPAGPLRELLAVFAPAVVKRANPMVAVREEVMGRLSRPLTAGWASRE